MCGSLRTPSSGRRHTGSEHPVCSDLGAAFHPQNPLEGPSVPQTHSRGEEGHSTPEMNGLERHHEHTTGGEP